MPPDQTALHGSGQTPAFDAALPFCLNTVLPRTSPARKPCDPPATGVNYKVPA